jgi:hypothetical protein
VLFGLQSTRLPEAALRLSTSAAIRGLSSEPFMKLFTCPKCQQVLFFENVQCTRCGQMLAYLPDQAVVTALEPEPERAADAAPALVPTAATGRSGVRRRRYRLCANYTEQGVCNWAVAADDGEALCEACRLNAVIPDLAEPSAREAWRRMEIAKHRLLYTVMQLNLPVETKAQSPGGIAFAFKRDGQGGEDRVFTGHNDGLITINLDEADDPSREKMRQQMGEAYRTLLGHFRHEVGHYYWDRLVRDSKWLEGYRALFGDERADYAASQQRHYNDGPPGDWESQFISSYASMHPWEDWAETFAHYLHMVDTLETARSFGLALRPKSVGGAKLDDMAARRLDFDDFDDLISAWFPLTIALNSLNRGMGLYDLYPFVLSEKVLEKLRFVHDLIESGSWDAIEPVKEAEMAGRPATPGPQQQAAMAT